MFGFSLGSSHFCQPARQRVAREAAEEGDLARLDLRVHDLGVRLAQVAGVLTDDGQVVGARPGHEAPGVGGNRDAGVGRLLHHGQHRVAEVRIADDQADVLCDRRLEVGDALVQVGVGALVDDLPDVLVRERLEDELHLRHLAIDVFAELLDVGDRELAAGARAAPVVLPALECQGLVDGPLRSAEPRQRDVARSRDDGKQPGLEERLCEGAHLRPVDLAEAASLADVDRACGLRMLRPGTAETGRGDRKRAHQQDERKGHHRALPSHRFPNMHRSLLSRASARVVPYCGLSRWCLRRA